MQKHTGTHLEDLPHARVGPGLAGVTPGETGDDAAPRGRDHAGAVTPAGEAAASRRQVRAGTGAASGRRGWSGHGHGDRAGSRHGRDATGKKQLDGKRARRSMTLSRSDWVQIGPMGWAATVFSFPAQTNREVDG